MRNLDLFEAYFVTLNVHYFFYCVFYVENCVVFCEIFLILVQNGIIEDIMHEIINEFGRWKYFGAAALEAIVNFLEVLLLAFILYLSNYLRKVLKKALHAIDLAN